MFSFPEPNFAEEDDHLPLKLTENVEAERSPALGKASAKSQHGALHVCELDCSEGARPLPQNSI